MSAWPPPPPPGSHELCCDLYLPEAADPIGLCKRKAQRRCPPPFAPHVLARTMDESACEREAAEEAAAPTFFGVEDRTGATAAVLSSAAVVGGAFSSMAAVATSALTLPQECPVCGRAPVAVRPRLLVSRAVVSWLELFSSGRITAADTQPYTEKDSTRVWLSDAASDGLQSGLVRSACVCGGYTFSAD